MNKVPEKDVRPATAANVWMAGRRLPLLAGCMASVEPSLIRCAVAVVSKVRKTLTLDPEIIDALGGDDVALSATINEILRDEVARRQRATALAGLLARLEVERGPVDPDEVAQFRRLLG